MRNRLVYIEPNDIAKEKLRNAPPNLTNVAWDAEDYNIYVDLQVVCPNRDDCGEETVGLGNNNYISLLEGVKLNSYSEVGNLTTSFTDISYSEIKNNSVSDKEALGITSIDITFDAHFYPKVNMNFTDVRAYSLFMPAEESYKEGLKTQAYETIDKDGNRLYNERGRAYTNFFSSLFHFPYPCFLLTVKGFYGTKVTFRLAVDTFKSALNSTTGNFDVSISFIGYMFGLYTDIPMTYVLCAPYVGELDYSLEEGSLVRSKYWNQRIADGSFKTKQGETIPTFLEFAQRYATVLNEINQDTDLGEDANNYRNHISYIAKLNEIEYLAKNLLNNAVLSETGVVTNGEFKGSFEINDDEKTHTFYLFTKSDENDGEITFTLNANKVKELHDTIKNANSMYKELNGDYHIEQFELSDLTVENTDVIKCSVLSKIDDYIDINKKNVPRIKIYGDGSKTKTYTYTHNNVDEDNALKGIKNNNSGSTIYVCAIKAPTFFKKLNDLKIRADENSGELRESAISDTEEFFARELGFTPNIENVFRMIFAHLECFCNSYMKETLGSIRSIRSTRTLGYLGVKKENTDVQSRDDESKTFAPPFFALYNDKREITYPGSYSNIKLRSIHEVKLVNSYIQAAKTFGEDYNKVLEYIQQMSVSNYYEEINELNNDYMGLPISYDGGFSPVTPYDAFYGNRNPYSFLQNTDKIEDILYHFLLRLYSSCLLGVHFRDVNKKDKYVDAEVKNILAVFPNLKKEDITNFKQIFKTTEGRDNDVIKYLLDPILDPSGNGNYKTKRLINIGGIFQTKSTDTTCSNCLPYIGDYRNGMLLVRFNSSKLYGDDDKQTDINKNIYNSLYNFKGINILGPSAYDIFKKTKEAIDGNFANNISIEDETHGEEKGELNVIYSHYEHGNANKIKLAVSNEQILSETEAVRYHLPFVLSYDNNNDKNGLNILTDNNFQTHDNIYGKAFVLLMGLVGARLAMAEGALNGFIRRELSTKDLKNNISLTKYVYTLFYGSIIYALKKYVNGANENDKKIYPNIFNDEGSEIKFKDIYTSNGFVKTSFVKKLSSMNDVGNGSRLTNLAIRIINVSNKKNRENDLTALNKTDLIDIFNDETFVLEENFIMECEPGGLLYNILQESKTENTEQVKVLEIDKKEYEFDDVNGINIFKTDSKTSKNLALLMSKSVCVLNTQYEKDEHIGFNQFNNTIYNTLLKKLEEQYEPSEEKVEEIVLDYTVSEHSDLQKSLYYTMKNLYDKWICSYGNIERFLLGRPEDDYNEVSKRFENKTRTNSIKEINNFIFVDSFYRDIGSDFMCNPSSIIELITMSVEGNNFSIYQFMHELCVKNKLLMRALPVYNNFYDPDGLKEIFKPNNVFNLSHAQEDGFSSTYLIMYTHQPSVHLNEGDDKKIGYKNDSFDIGDTIVLNEFEYSTDSSNGEKKNNYLVPAFGVTYSAQNQSYFKNININMDNPITTDYSIMNQIQLSQTAASGDLNHPVGIGQNIYSIYSNRSYNCTVEMMGCANIMPMMYFQLNNIPMFKGAYMITSVKHSIKAGNMTTTFTGVRQSRILYPFVNSSLILTSLMDRLNGPIKIGKIGENLITGEPIQYQSDIVPTESTDSNIPIHVKSLITEFTWKRHANGHKYPLIYRSSTQRPINKIVLHYTAGTSSEAKDSVDNSNAFIMATWWNKKWNEKGKEVSADFGVDDKYIVQFNPDIDRYSSFAFEGHADAISIEMCSTFDQSVHPFNEDEKPPNMPQWKFTDKVLENTKQLVLSLYKKYNREIPLSTHYLEKGKSCPGIKGWNGNKLRDEKGKKTNVKNNQDKFEAFKAEIHEAWVALSAAK